MLCKLWRETNTSSTERLLVLLAAAGTLLLLLPLSDPAATPPQIDEFIVLTNARLVWSGALPYRDFFNFIPPVSNWLYAALFWLGGDPDVGLARMATHISVVVSGLLLYRTLRNLRLSPARAAIPGLVYATLFYPLWSVPLHHWIAIMLGSAAMATLVAALRAATTRRVMLWAVVTGALLVVTALTVQTHGAVVAVTLVALSIVAPLQVGGVDGPVVGPQLGRLYIGMAIGAASLLAVFFLYLLITDTLAAFMTESVLFLFLQYRREGSQNDVPLLGDLGTRFDILTSLGAPLWARVGLTAAAASALLASGATLVWTVWRSAELLLTQRARVIAVAALLPAAASCAVFLVRPDVFHVVFYATWPLTMAAVLLPRASSSTRAWPARIFVGVIGLCVLAGLLGHLGIPFAQGARAQRFAVRHGGDDPVLAGLAPVDAAMVDADPVLRFVRHYALTHPGARLFASVNGLSAYFLAMPPAVADIVAYPPGGRFTGERELVRIHEQLADAPAALLLFRPAAHADRFLSPPESASPPAHALAKFLRLRYHPLAKNRSTAIFELNSEEAAAGQPGSFPER